MNIAYGIRKGRIIKIYAHKRKRKTRRHKSYILWKRTKRNLPNKTYRGKLYKTRKAALSRKKNRFRSKKKRKSRQHLKGCARYRNQRGGFGFGSLLSKGKSLMGKAAGAAEESGGGLEKDAENALGGGSGLEKDAENALGGGGGGLLSNIKSHMPSARHMAEGAAAAAALYGASKTKMGQDALSRIKGFMGDGGSTGAGGADTGGAAAGGPAGGGGGGAGGGGSGDAGGPTPFSHLTKVKVLPCDANIRPNYPHGPDGCGKYESPKPTVKQLVDGYVSKNTLYQLDHY